MNKYVNFEYLKDNNPKPDGIQYKGLFGNRSLGKTHGVLKFLLSKLEPGQAIMILRRNKLELDFRSFVSKYSAAFNQYWDLDNGIISRLSENEEAGDRIIIYTDALSLAERKKNNNYDSPYVRYIIVDEVFAEKPNKNEFNELQLWIGTLSRRTGYPFHPVEVWLLGNSDYGYSPILESLGIYKTNGLKQKTPNGVYLFSEMESPEDVVNVVNPLIRKFEIRKGNEPLLTWTYLGNAYALYDIGMHTYIKRVEKGSKPFNFEVKRDFMRAALRKDGIPRVYVEDYDCIRFLTEPALRVIL